MLKMLKKVHKLKNLNNSIKLNHNKYVRKN